MLKVKFRELLSELQLQVSNHYGSRLVTLTVFGSVGRGTQRADSDVDLMIAENLPDGRLKRMSEFEKIEEALKPSLRRLKDEGIETCLSPVIKTPREVKQGSLLFVVAP